jgi:hypothetical protein
MYFETLQSFSKMLQNMSGWLDKLETYAAERKFDPTHLFSARLSPDQFPLLKQIQISCDTAKFMAARLSGQEAPTFGDTETNLAELKTRIAETVVYLQGFKAEDFAGADQRQVILPFLPNLYMTGKDYLEQFASPNFYFHLNMVYALLRHNGVPLGKQDYLGQISLHPLSDG